MLRGLAVVLAAGLVVFLFSTFGIDRLRFDPGAILAFRIISWLSLAVLVVWFVIRPLLRRAPDERVALYLEENEPSLQSSVLSAVAATSESALGSAGDETMDERGFSPLLTRGLIERAAQRVRDVDEGRRVDGRRLRSSSAWLAGALTAIAATWLLSPGFLGNAGPLLLRPWTSADAASPYSIHVEPGNTLIARGADQAITAATVGFETQEVEIAVRRGQALAWERWLMSPDPEAGGFEILLFDVSETTEYLVEAEGVRSELYRIEVADLPYVDRIDLEYRFPSYTGLMPQLVEDGGDIAALRGTEVGLLITPTLPVEAGRIVFDTAEDSIQAIDLVPAEGGLTATIRVETERFYRVELQGPTGSFVVASPDYLIEPLDDQPPAVRITEPGRDTRVSTIEEVFTEVEAEDDYGVGRVELVYSVNGGEEQSITLHASSRGGQQNVSRGHTFFLEEMALEPGDFIAYHARATDLNSLGGAQTETSDLYFLEIRPFDQTFRQADQGQAPGQGQGGGMNSGLSEQQKQIVAATFNLLRDEDEYDGDQAAENYATLALLQGRLREQVESIVQQMAARGVAADSTFLTIAEELPQAAEAMSRAEVRLGEKRGQDALPPEQEALQHLQRAEAAYREVQVSMEQGGGGGGGGGGGPQAEELADLFELELDKLRNQYESVQRGERRERDAQVDEALQRLQELARRQQQLNERARAQSGGAGGGRASQNQLIDETEELSRELERLARQDERPELEQSARRLQDAADAMRRATARGESGQAEGSEALDGLREARRLLENRQAAALEREVEDAVQRAERIAEKQESISEEMNRLSREAERGGTAPERERELAERKQQLAGEVAGLESDLDRMARESRREQRGVSEELQGAANSIRDNKLKEKILYSRGLIGDPSGEYARNFEEEISSNADEVRDRLEAAQQAFGESDPRRLDRQLDETRDLVQGLESLQERLRQRGETGEEQAGAGDGQPSQGEQGQSGEGQEGQQGQGGQGGEGQEGQQGQGGDRPTGQPGATPSPGGEGPGGFSAEDVRQFQQEFRQRRADAEQLRDELAREGVDVGELDDAIARLRELDDARVYQDLAEIERLQDAVLLGLKDFEFSLRRQVVGPEADRLFLSGSEEVPDEYRELVEQYYRSLSEDDGSSDDGGG